MEWKTTVNDDLSAKKIKKKIIITFIVIKMKKIYWNFFSSFSRRSCLKACPQNTLQWKNLVRTWNFFYLIISFFIPTNVVVTLDQKVSNQTFKLVLRLGLGTFTRSGLGSRTGLLKVRARWSPTCSSRRPSFHSLMELYTVSSSRKDLDQYIRCFWIEIMSCPG